MWGFKENLRGECQKLMKIVKIEDNKVNPKTSDKSKRSPRFRIHHLCMLHFNSCLFRSRKSKKKIRFAFRKNLKLKISEFRPTRPHKKTTYRHQRHLPSLRERVLQASYIIHWACMQEKPAPVKDLKFTLKIDFNLKKNRQRIHFFLLKNTKADATKLNYHVSYRRPFPETHCL